MTIFLIILAVLAVLIIILLNLSATITLVYDKGWQTKLSVLFIERDIEISKILSFILFPEKKGQEAAEKAKKKKNKKSKPEAPEKTETVAVEKPEPKVEEKTAPTENDKPDEKAASEPQKKPAKKNPIAKLWDDDGIVGILTLITNLLETANSAVLTLFRGLHIYSLYVMIIVGGGDADFIARSYGKLCQYYYPVKGLILNGMRVDKYDDYIQPDFIAPSTEFELQLIASISVGLLLKTGLKAGIVFLKNFIKDKNTK